MRIGLSFALTRKPARPKRTFRLGTFRFSRGRYNHCFGETLYYHGDYFDALKSIPGSRLSLLNRFLPEGSSFHDDPEMGPREEDAVRRDDPLQKKHNPHLKPSRKLGGRTVRSNCEKLRELRPGDLKLPKRGGFIIR